MGKWDKVDKINTPSKSLEQFISEPITHAMQQLTPKAKAGRKPKSEEPLVSIHLKLVQSDLHFLDKELSNDLRNSGDPRWQGNIYRPDLIHYLIDFYKNHKI